MKLKITATPNELAEKSEQLVRQVSALLRYANPELSESLEKALPTKEPVLKYPVLQELLQITQDSYEKHLKLMLDEIGKVLDESIDKSLEPGDLAKAVEGEVLPHKYLSRKRAAEGGHWIYKYAKKLGGKISEHKTDPNMVMLKVPKEHAQLLIQLKQDKQLEGEISIGDKYAMIPVAKPVVEEIKVAPKPVKEKKKPSATDTVMQKPPYAKLEWEPHTTVEDANAWAKNLGIHTDYPSLDVANSGNRAISEQHPLVIENLQFMGTGKQLNEWAKAHPAENKIAMTEAKHPMDLTKGNPLGGGAIAVAHPYTAKPYTKSVMIIEDSYYDDGYTKGVKNGFSNTGNLKDTMIHEFGHVEGFVMRHLYPENSELSVWEIWKKHIVPILQSDKANGTRVVKDTISNYGGTNPHEAWAEVSVMRRNGMPLAGWIQDALKEMQIDSTDWHTMYKKGK